MSNNNTNSNKINVPEARAAMEQFKFEVANEIGISQAQVSRLEKSAIDHMKKYI